MFKKKKKKKNCTLFLKQENCESRILDASSEFRILKILILFRLWCNVAHFKVKVRRSGCVICRNSELWQARIRAKACLSEDDVDGYANVRTASREQSQSLLDVPWTCR